MKTMNIHKQHYMDRMNNIQAFRVYCHLVNNSEQSVVKELYNNLNEHVHDHPKWPMLKELFAKRIPNDVV